MEEVPRKKKILYIITKGNFGGAQRYVYDLATNLPKGEFEAVVACGEGNLLKEKLEEANIKVIALENSQREISASKDFKTLKYLVKIIREEKPDVVHLNSSKIGLLGSLAVLYLKLTPKNYHLKTIFTTHGWAFNERTRPVWWRAVFYLCHYLTAIICNTTIAVSEKAKRDADFPFIQDKIKVVYNGISVFDTLPAKEALRILTKDSKKPGQTVIFSASELHLNKGVDVAVRGLALLNEETRGKIIYCVAGEGEEKERIQNLVSKMNLQDSVRLLGFVPDAKKLLSACDIFLLPSRTEALPYALLEAGRMGLPTIASCVGGIPEVVKDMQNGILVHPRNPKEIAEAILYMLDHPEKQKEFGSEIKKTVLNFFSLEKMISETISVYSS